MGEETDEDKKQFEIITLLHPAIVENFSNFNPDIQDALRSGLLNCVLARANDMKCMSGLGLLIRQIVEVDNQSQGGFDEWV